MPKFEATDFYDIDALLTALRVTYRFSAELPHVAGPRQADAVHASCVAHVVRRLRGNGWDVRREVEIRDRRSSGWIDVLAWDDARRRLLVVEVKTEIRDLGDIERTMAWYEREAPGVARSFGWHSRQTRSALLVLHSRANDERVATRDALTAWSCCASHQAAPD